jgi:hypothetical protein
MVVDVNHKLVILLSKIYIYMVIVSLRDFQNL